MKFLNSQNNKIFDTDIAIKELKELHTKLIHNKINLKQADIILTDDTRIQFNLVINNLNQLIYKIDDEIDAHLNLMYQNQVNGIYKNQQQSMLKGSL